MNKYDNNDWSVTFSSSCSHCHLFFSWRVCDAEGTLSLTAYTGGRQMSVQDPCWLISPGIILTDLLINDSGIFWAIILPNISGIVTIQCGNPVCRLASRDDRGFWTRKLPQRFIDIGYLKLFVNIWKMVFPEMTALQDLVTWWFSIFIFGGW